jgi:hypothetical protein
MIKTTQRTQRMPRRPAGLIGTAVEQFTGEDSPESQIRINSSKPAVYRIIDGPFEILDYKTQIFIALQHVN